MAKMSNEERERCLIAIRYHGEEAGMRSPTRLTGRRMRPRRWLSFDYSTERRTGTRSAQGAAVLRVPAPHGQDRGRQRFRASCTLGPLGDGTVWNHLSPIESWFGRTGRGGFERVAAPLPASQVSAESGPRIGHYGDVPLSETTLLKVAGDLVYARGEDYVRYVRGLRTTDFKAYASIQAKNVYTVELRLVRSATRRVLHLPAPCRRQLLQASGRDRTRRDRHRTGRGRRHSGQYGRGSAGSSGAGDGCRRAA